MTVTLVLVLYSLGSLIRLLVVALRWARGFGAPEADATPSGCASAIAPGTPWARQS